jgi:hypothetical protein
VDVGGFELSVGVKVTVEVGMGVWLGTVAVALAGTEAVGEEVSPAVPESTAAGAFVVWVGAGVVGLRVDAALVEVARGVFGAEVLVGAAVVGRRVGEGPTVGTVWKSGAPQV